jgi:hypothetical protein
MCRSLDLETIKLSTSTIARAPWPITWWNKAPGES